MPFIISLAGIGIALAATFFFWLAGIASVSPGEVGILVKNIGDNRGMQREVLSVGLHWINPITYDVVVYDTRLRQYTLAADDGSVIPANTKDGQPITVDVSLEVGLTAERVPDLHQNVGPDWFNRIVWPAARSELRTATGNVLSDRIYTGEGREIVQRTITDVLHAKLAPNGITVAVNIREIRFTNQEFINTLEEKATAAQQEEIQSRLAKAAAQEAIRVANIAEGKKQQSIKESEAIREQSRLQGEGNRLQMEETAKGTLAQAKAEAEGVRLRREALSGAGGPELVSIEWAKNLGPNVKVYAVPTGSPGTSSFLDLNGLLKGGLRGND